MARSSSGRHSINNLRRRFSDDSSYVDYTWERRDWFERNKNFARYEDWRQRRLGPIRTFSLIGLPMVLLVAGGFAYAMWSFVRAVRENLSILWGF